MERSLRPKQRPPEQKNDIDPNGRRDIAVEQKHATAEDVEIGSAEARVGETDSISVKQQAPAQDSAENVYCEKLPQDATLCNVEQMEFQVRCMAGNIPDPKHTISDKNYNYFSKALHDNTLRDNLVIGIENVEDGPTVDRELECQHTSVEQNGTCAVEKTENISLEPFMSPTYDLNMKCKHDQLELISGEATNCNPLQLETHSNYMSKNHDIEQLATAQEIAAKTPNQLGHKEKRSRGRPRKAENSPTSSVGGTRVLPQKGKDSKISSEGSARLLRSRSQEKSKTPVPSNNLPEVGADSEKRRRRKKKKRMEKPVNEFARIRTHLRYLVHRIKYEQNFIDAYSGEGWKGQSLEKIKPEKELQRAKSEIFRRKLKIRDLFQHLYLSCAEGRLPEALFDSAGEIDSEDIFCAKCGSKDVSLTNDIILCDGACERGFHQFCLDPPLLKEHIPPGDEGWLCPGCDCKLDCIVLLNETQGTKISVNDGWEKVFPEEAAAAAAGNMLDDNLGLPSDDDEDDDYNPDGPQLDEEVQGDESSSDESDYYSAPEDVGALPNNKQTLGLPSDDSEDDDFNPSGLDPDPELKEESSSSDFTSDSEDFSVAFDENQPSGEDQKPNTSTLDHIKVNEEICDQSEMKKQSVSGELHDVDPGQGDSASIYPKRHVERLDYKKLHDEEYGETSSDSSDEDFVGIASPKKRRNIYQKSTLMSSSAETPMLKLGEDASEPDHNHEESEGTHKRGTSKKSDVKGIDSSSDRSRKDSSATGSSGKSTTRSTYAEDVTQKLFKSFKENQYPGRVVKENLARELKLTVQQVAKWFDNTRWSFRHSSRMALRVDDVSHDKGTADLINSKDEQAQASSGVNECCSKDVKLHTATENDNGQNSSISKTKKRKGKFDTQTGLDSSTEATTQPSVDVIPVVTRGRKSSRLQSKSMNSVS